MAVRNKDVGQRYSAPVSLERQERLRQIYNRQEMSDWAKKNGIHDKVLQLIVAQVREREGLSTDPRSWRIISAQQNN